MPRRRRRERPDSGIGRRAAFAPPFLLRSRRSVSLFVAKGQEVRSGQTHRSAHGHLQKLVVWQAVRSHCWCGRGSAFAGEVAIGKRLLNTIPYLPGRLLQLHGTKFFHHGPGLRMGSFLALLSVDRLGIFAAASPQSGALPRTHCGRSGWRNAGIWPPGTLRQQSPAYQILRHGLLSPFEWRCRNFILPEFRKACLVFAKLVIPYSLRYTASWR